MLRLRAVFSGVYKQVFDRKEATIPFTEGDIERMTQMTSTLLKRQRNGATTSLRQLHAVCELEQPEALLTLAELRTAGIVSITENASDEFESLIQLNEEGLLRLSQITDQKAA